MIKKHYKFVLLLLIILSLLVILYKIYFPNNNFNSTNNNMNIKFNLRDIFNIKSLVNVYKGTGDVNGDGQVTPLDYVKIKNHIMGTLLITDENILKSADVNNDGEISALDYVIVKNIIINNNEDNKEVTYDSSIGCIGDYENGYGLASLRVTTENNTFTNYKFYSDDKELQSSSSPYYNADNNYTLLINPKVEVTDKNGEVKTALCNLSTPKLYTNYNKNGNYYHKLDSSSPYPNNISYYVYFPDKITDKVPLIIGLHGGFGWGVNCGEDTPYSENGQTNYYLKNAIRNNETYKKNNDKVNGFINNSFDYKVNAIVLAPSNMSCTWDGSIYDALDIVYAYLKLYAEYIDYDRIIVNGSSQGGYGTLLMGMLEEHVIYPVLNDKETLDSIAQKYGTTANEIKSYYKSLNNDTISYKYKDEKNGILKKGTKVIIRPKNNSDQRSLFSVLIAFSPASSATKCMFTPNILYNSDTKCNDKPVYTIKTPIWVIASENESKKVNNFASELANYYKDNIRYTKLRNTKEVYGIDNHHTQKVMLGRTSLIEWMIKQKRGKVNITNDYEISEIEQSISKVFSGVWKSN